MLKGRCALITGSTQGLGYAMAERLAADGCNIVLNGFGDGRRDRSASGGKLEQDHGVRALHHGADLAEPAQIAALVETARQSFGAVDILINNAVVRYFAPIEAFKPEDWDRALAVNLSAAFHTSRLVLPGMRARNFGRIVNIASIYGLFATVNRVDYVTTKTALDRLHPRRGAGDGGPEHHLQRHLPRHGADPQHRAAAGGRDGEVGPVARGGRTGFPRLAPAVAPLRGDPGGVAALVALLCGPAGADITGTAIPIDGGWSAS